MRDVWAALPPGGPSQVAARVAAAAAAGLKGSIQEKAASPLRMAKRSPSSYCANEAGTVTVKAGAVEAGAVEAGLVKAGMVKAGQSWHGLRLGRT